MWHFTYHVMWWNHSLMFPLQPSAQHYLRIFLLFFESVELWTCFFSRLQATRYQGSCLKVCFSVSKTRVGIKLLIAKETRALQPQGNVYTVQHSLKTSDCACSIREHLSALENKPVCLIFPTHEWTVLLMYFFKAFGGQILCIFGMWHYLAMPLAFGKPCICIFPVMVKL